MKDLPRIGEVHLNTVCKPGQGNACCRYLVFGSGFECAKLSELKDAIDHKAATGQYTAIADNCAGFPMIEK